MEQQEKIKSEVRREVKKEALDEPFKVKKPKDYQYQDFLSVCLKKVDANEIEGKSAIEILKDKDLNVNEQMRACAGEWREKYRGKEDPSEAIKEDLSKKLTKQEEVEPESGEE